MRCKSHGLDPWIRKDPLEKQMATNSSILAWKIGENKEPGGLLFIQLQRAGHDWAYANTHTHAQRETSEEFFVDSITAKGRKFQSWCGTPGWQGRPHSGWESKILSTLLFSSVQLSPSVVSESLQPHESQHTRPPCPSPIPGVYPNSCPSSWWCHPAISSSVIPFSSWPQSLPASGSFPISQPFAWGGQSIGVSASASVLPKNTQDWSPLGWTGWISFQSKGLSRVFSNTTVQKHQFFGAQLSSQSNSHIHTWPQEKP